jgi:hypothetical protein
MLTAYKTRFYKKLNKRLFRSPSSIVIIFNLSVLNLFYSSFSVDISRSYAFYYNPGFKAIEDGWTSFQPEEEFSKLIHCADSEWRISYVNIEYEVCFVTKKQLPSFLHNCYS